MIFTIINIILISLLIYSLLLYAPILTILAKIFKKSPKFDINFKPGITFLVAAYNEGKYIENALKSIIELNYDQSKIQVIIGSDGSNDNTVEICESYKDKLYNLQVLDLSRSGKNNVLNSLYPLIQNDFVYILDADFRLTKESINESIKFFADENVGAVISKLNMVSDCEISSGIVGEEAYQNLDNYIKVKESEIWTTVNNFGCYGIRHNLIETIPSIKVCDDMFNILKVATSGKRVIISNQSVVNEVREKNIIEEINRRERISSGALSTLSKVRSILNPLKGWASFFYYSHRFLRFFYPIILILIFLFTPFIYFESKTIFYIFAIGQLCFYTSALIGYFLDKRKIVLKIFSFPFFFLMLNIGYLKGIIQFIRHEQSSVWERMDTH